jgi:hypothetical protein
MKAKPLLPAIITVLLTSTAAMAQQPTENVALISRLEQAKQDCEWKTRTLKGGPQGSMLLHQRTMDNVLEQLKAGQSVDHQKIEKAFENHSG